MRYALRFLFAAVGLLVAAWLLPGIQHDGFLVLVGVAVLLGILNATIGAFLKVMALVPMACTFGCFSFVINGLIFLLTSWIAGKLGLPFHVSNFWSAFFGAIITSGVAFILERVFIGREQPPEAPQGPRPRKIIN